MLKSSLLEIIRTFTPKELIKFEEFVNSPYFNKKDVLLKLLLEITKYAPEFINANLEKEKVWKKLFPEKEYNYGIMKNLIFDLNKLAEQFMIDQKFTIDTDKQNEYLMSSLLVRELNKIYKNKYNSLSPEPDLKVINANMQNIADYFDHVNTMYYMKLFYHHHHEQNYNPEELQINRDSSLIAGFLIKLFGSYNDVVAIETMGTSDHREKIVPKFIDLISPGLESIINLIPQKSDVNSVYVTIYYRMYLSILEKTEQRYREFKKSVYENINILPKLNIRAIHHCLITAAINSKFETLDRNREIIEILDSLAEHNAITETGNDRIPLHVFTTYVSLCYSFGDSKKLKSFADRFVDKLDPDVKTNTSIHVNFMICFLKKSYDEALKYISMLDIPYIFLKPAIRYDKIKCLYETDNYEMFLNEFDSMKHFLKKSKLMTDTQKDSLIFRFSIVKRLFNLRQNFDEHEFIKLKNKISDISLINAIWLIEKLEEIAIANKYKVKS